MITDGCTGAPDGNFKHCCVQHDAYYGDGSVSRFTADNQLRKCIYKSNTGNPLSKVWHFGVSIVYFLGVRVFGGSRYNK